MKAATGGKGGDPARMVYDKNYNPSSSIQKKGDFDYKGATKKGEEFVAGANILDEKGKTEKRKSFEEHMKSGGRANDPRNWEFHYKDPSAGGRKRWSQTKGMSGEERRAEAFKSARMSAQKKAKLTGKDIYEVQKIEYETTGIIQESDAARAKAKAIGGAGRWGSTRVASNVAAAKMQSERKTSRGRAQATTGVFDKKPKKRPGALA